MNKYLKQKSIENRSFTNFDIKTPPQEKNIYGSRDVCKITGLTYKQLDYYDRTDFLSPSVNQAVGYGSKRMYSFNDLLKLKVVKSLLDAGISLLLLYYSCRIADCKAVFRNGF
jgi:hypothetical protein